MRSLALLLLAIALPVRANPPPLVITVGEEARPAPPPPAPRDPRPPIKPGSAEYKKIRAAFDAYRAHAKSGEDQACRLIARPVHGNRCPARWISADSVNVDLGYGPQMELPYLELTRQDGRWTVSKIGFLYQ